MFIVTLLNFSSHFYDVLLFYCFIVLLFSFYYFEIRNGLFDIYYLLVE